MLRRPLRADDTSGLLERLRPLLLEEDEDDDDEEDGEGDAPRDCELKDRGMTDSTLTSFSSRASVAGSSTPLLLSLAGSSSPGAANAAA